MLSEERVMGVIVIWRRREGVRVLSGEVGEVCECYLEKKEDNVRDTSEQCLGILSGSPLTTRHSPAAVSISFTL